jgi:hypothetical protein
MNDLESRSTTLDSSWSAEANPDLGYDDGEPATEPKTVDPDTSYPGDPGDPPRPRADQAYDEGDPATEPPTPDPDTDYPGGPPSASVAETNGR